MPRAQACAYNRFEVLQVPSHNRMTFRTLATILVLVCAAGAARPDALPDARRVAQMPSAESLPAVDHVLVRKGDRRLLLMHGGNIVRSYHVALGLRPVGQKERSGDFRTPEGSYRLDLRNARTHYFLSIKGSYPNKDDVKRARSRHWDAGGSIMIHGLPNQLRHDPDFYLHHDWTDGCIAVSNADMVEIWMLT